MSWSRGRRRPALIWRQARDAPDRLDQVRHTPSRGVPLGRLAAECCGDAHALDDGRPVGTLVLSAVGTLVLSAVGTLVLSAVGTLVLSAVRALGGLPGVLRPPGPRSRSPRPGRSARSG
jgi:Protein of unknown function N-terminus (DUF3323)